MPGEDEEKEGALALSTSIGGVDKGPFHNQLK